MVNGEDSRLDSGIEFLCAVPGRIRLRASDSSSRAVLDAVAEQLQPQNGVAQVRRSEQTGSLLINFDPSQLSLSQLLELLGDYGISTVKDHSPEASQAALGSDAWKQAQTQLQSFIPLIVGLLTTRQLGIQGWQSIPVYMITASLVRQVMENLDLGETAPPIGGLSQETRAEFNEKLAPDAGTDNQAVAYSVIHAIPGRMRLRVPRIAEDSDYAQQLQRLVKDDAWISGVRVNPATASVVITYEPEVGSESEMVSYLNDLIQIAGESAAPPTRPAPEETSDRATPTDSTQAELPQPTVTDEVTVELSPEPMPEAANDEVVSPEETRKSPDALNLHPGSSWSRFKSAALSTMLRLMANQPALET